MAHPDISEVSNDVSNEVTEPTVGDKDKRDSERDREDMRVELDSGDRPEEDQGELLQDLQGNYLDSP